VVGAASVAISTSRLALQAAMLRFDIGSEEMGRLVAPGATQHAVVDFSDQLVGARSRRAYLSDREPGSYLAVAGTERYSIGLDKL
jgi:hypothetical protein